MYEFSYFAI